MVVAAFQSFYSGLKEPSRSSFDGEYADAPTPLATTKGPQPVEKDMKFALKSIVAAASFVMAGAAFAAPVTVTTDDVYKGLTATGTGKLEFSAALLEALDVGKIAITPFGDLAGSVIDNSQGFYSEVSASAGITSLTIDSASDEVLSAATTGGLTQVAPVQRSVSRGGSLTVTDLNVDLVNKRVFATIIGGNGVGTLNNFHLWDIANISGATKVEGPGTYVTTLSGLSITSAGFNAFTQSLGLLTLGVGALQTVEDFGVITSTITATAVTPAIPEPSTYALMGLGLVGIALAARRRAK